MSPTVRSGFIAAFTAYALWGLLPAYLKLVAHLPALQVVGHRILWSIPCALILLAFASGFALVRRSVNPRTLGLLALTSCLIGFNWGVYVWAVAQERVLEASLGYFLNPLVAVGLGVIVLKEALNRFQIVAIGFAILGVGVLVVAAGTVPYVAPLLCFSFAFYGLLKKQIDVDARVGLLLELLLIAPVALLGLAWLGNQGVPTWGEGPLDAWVLVLSGPATAIPLILFAFGAKRLRMATLGLLQYIAPTGQFLIGLAFGEAFTQSHAIAFGLIWAGLAIFSWDALKSAQAARRARAADTLASDGAA